MGWLDRLFGNQSDPQAYSGAASGWLGPIAGGPAAPAESEPPRFPLLATPNAPPVPPAADSDVGRASAPNPSMSLFGGVGRDGWSGLGNLGGALQGPSLLERLSAGANNLTTGGNPLAGLVNSVNGLATGQRMDRAGIEQANEHATMSALMNAGLDAATARAAASHPELLKALVVARYGGRAAPRQVLTSPSDAAAAGREGARPCRSCSGTPVSGGPAQ